MKGTFTPYEALQILEDESQLIDEDTENIDMVTILPDDELSDQEMFLSDKVQDPLDVQPTQTPMAQSPPLSKSFEWTRTITRCFIRLLKEHPCLWNFKCTGFKNKTIKKASLETIKSDLSSYANSTLRNDDMIKKIHSLKTQFNREMFAIKASQNSATGDVYTPKLWCFDELRFLVDAEAPTSTSNLNEEINTVQIDEATTLSGGDNDSVSETQDVPSPHPTPSQTSVPPSPFHSCSSGGPYKKKKKIDEIDKVMELAFNKLSSLPSCSNRESLLDISKFVDSEIKNMSELQQKLAKKLICDVLHMGNMGDLTRGHKVA